MRAFWLFDGAAGAFYDVFLGDNEYDDWRDDHDNCDAEHRDDLCLVDAFEGCKAEGKCVFASVLQEDQWAEIVVPYADHVQYADQDK